LKKICIIPARGGSKRIPKKNIKLFFGKPIIYYSIINAINLNFFDEIIVSTDDNEIAELAKKFGAKVPFFRSRASSSDFATTFDVVVEVVNNLNLSLESICVLYPCAPLLPISKILEAYNLMVDKKFDSVFPIIPSGFPVQRVLTLDTNNKVEFMYPEFELTRTQDCVPTFHDAGQFYWLKAESCLNKGKILTNNSGAIVLNEFECQDIDNEYDWKLAEIKYQMVFGHLFSNKI
jgi:N-acylneuraminate cytidylyltransferase